MNPAVNEGYIKEIKEEQIKVKNKREESLRSAEYISLDNARSKKFKINFTGYKPAKPRMPGVTVYKDYSLEEIRKYIDWSFFFLTWNIRGRYPDIFKDKDKGIEAKKLFDDANKLLDEIINKKLLQAKGVVGIFPANSNDNDDIEIYVDESRKEVRAIVSTLRQQKIKEKMDTYYSLSDYIASGRAIFRIISDFLPTLPVSGLIILLKNLKKQ